MGRTEGPAASALPLTGGQREPQGASRGFWNRVDLVHLQDRAVCGSGVVLQGKDGLTGRALYGKDGR